MREISGGLLDFDVVDAKTGEITDLLNAAGREAVSADRLWELIYPELRRRAKAICQTERNDHTLSATAVVNEAFVRLSTRDHHEWNDRSHFYAVASNIMRRVLIDHARARLASKRGGGAYRESLDESIFPSVAADEAGFRAAEDALEQLATEHERAALVVTMKVFGGLTIPEIVRDVGVSERTIKNDWSLAREKLRGIL